MAPHPLPPSFGFLGIGGFAKHLAFKRQHGVTPQHGMDRWIRQLGMHRCGLGLSQQAYEVCWLGMLDAVFIHPTHLHTMGDAGLLQQTTAGRGRGSQQKHGASENAADPENDSVSSMRVIAQDPSELTQHALRRARQAVRCLPFRRSFYRLLEESAQSSKELANRPDWRVNTSQRLGAGETETLLIWLIQLGVLRREVDGQGLTERVRITPLGRDVLADWPEVIPAADPLSRVMHWCRRRRPRW